MSLHFFKQRDIDEIDINDIPEEFINYFDTLDIQGKIALVGSRSDLAMALGLTSDMEDNLWNNNDDQISRLTDSNQFIDDENSDEDFIQEEMDDIDDEDAENTVEESEEFRAIYKNYYEGKDISKEIKDNMQPLEVLAIQKDQRKCMLHNTPFELKQIRYRSSRGGTLGIVLRACKQCNRIYIEEDVMPFFHEKMIDRGIPHTFYNLELTKRYLHSQIKEHEFESDEKIYVPDAWIEENPICPLHNTELLEIPCSKTYKDRKVSFKGYYCDKCQKILVRRVAEEDLEYKCANAGVPIIEFEPITEKIQKKPLPSKTIKPDYMIDGGEIFHYTYRYMANNCFRLGEEDTVIVSDSIYCNMEGHETDEVKALMTVDQKKDGKRTYLFLAGYCEQCQKYYMDNDDYKVIYPIGRPEVNILSDIDTDYQITSGQVFNIEKTHLKDLEGSISKEIDSIKGSSDYVNPYTTGDYDDGNLAYAKNISKRKYAKKMSILQGYVNKPYSYRVDINAENQTETYYIGASDINIGGNIQVISANSDFGHRLINYRTIKVKKEGKEFGIKLSRQFDIENANLYGYTNLRTDEDQIFKKGITDPFLVRVLNMRKRQHNLTDIFVTIQENQNRIVDADFNINIIVQGCAGSGKTMVLLHRLSSLCYRLRDFDFYENALILTPNNQFSLHIKGLADELQVGYIQRMSVEEYYIAMLSRYDVELEPKNNVTSEALVRQDYVDYIYSDRFRHDFSEAYIRIIQNRNEIASALNELSDAIGEPRRQIEYEDDAHVAEQMRVWINAINRAILRKDEENASAKETYEKLLDRTRFLEERMPDIKRAADNVVLDSLSSIYKKINSYMGRQAHEMETLRKTTSDLMKEQKRVQETFMMTGKESRLEKLNEQIQKNNKILNNAEEQFSEQAKLLGKIQSGKTEHEVFSWMMLVAQIIDSVWDDIYLCNQTKEKYEKYNTELKGLNQELSEALDQYNLSNKNIFSEQFRQTAQDISERIGHYSLLGTYQLVLNEATKEYKNEHQIKNIRGNCHRFDLYARLLFSMMFFGHANGNTLFMCVDEGQDLALNEYKLINELNYGKVVFNIFGDTNQLIKPGRGIANWDELERIFQAQRYELNENYRNTNQITKFCNRSFGMNVLQTGVDGSKVKEISRQDLEKEIAALNVTTQRIAILVPRQIQKKKYLKKDSIPEEIMNLVDEDMENGHIALMYVDEVKGIEFDKVFVVSNGMTRNEKYIAYTRALSDLIIVVDESIKPRKRKSNSRERKTDKNPTNGNGTLKWQNPAV